jgi:hypothetical protein
MSEMGKALLRGVVVDRAAAITERYRKGELHGREVSTMLGELFNAANDVIEQQPVDREALISAERLLGVIKARVTSLGGAPRAINDAVAGQINEDIARHFAAYDRPE